MGICDSSPNIENKKNVNHNPKPKINFINEPSGIYEKYNITDDNIDIIRQKNNGYILPTSLAKRDNVEKYYNIDNKILGEGSYGQVCIGTKNGKIRN